MNQETRYSLERYFDCRIKVRKATAHERAETSVSVSSDTGSLFVPPTLTASEYSVYWSFNNRLDMENKSSKEISHLLFCSRLLTEQEEIRIEHWKNHYFSQVIEVIANESEKGIVLLQKGNILHYENPTARKWHLSERFFDYCAESEDKNIETSESYTILLSGTSPLKLRLYNFYREDTFIGRMILGTPFSGETANGIDTAHQKSFRVSEDHWRQPPAQTLYQHSCEGRRYRLFHTDQRRKRDRKRTVCQGHPQCHPCARNTPL